MLENFDYNVKKTEDCVLININNWVQVSDIIIQKINGKYSTSCITEALKIHEKNYKNSPIKEGSYMLITSVAADVCRYTNFEINGEKFFNLPIMQVLGIFKNNLITFNNLEMVYDKILVEKIDTSSYAGIVLPETNEMIGRILKVGSSVTKLNINDIIFIKDNVSTPIRLDGKEYFATEERAAVGIFKKTTETENISFINNSILMTPYIPTKISSSSTLINPEINYEDLDYSNVYNRDLFQIKFLDKDLKKIKQGDVILVKRDFTNYVYLNQEKYFLLNGNEWIEAKITL